MCVEMGIHIDNKAIFLSQHRKTGWFNFLAGLLFTVCDFCILCISYDACIIYKNIYLKTNKTKRHTPFDPQHKGQDKKSISVCPPLNKMRSEFSRRNV